MQPPVKICGLSTVEAVSCAVSGGVSHVGFIFFEKSPRHISREQAADLAGQTGSARRVAVSVDADNTYLDNIVEALDPHVLQLHGNETPQRIQEVKARYDRPVIKAMSVRNPDDLAMIMSYERLTEFILLDAKPPKGSQLPGGNGVSFDWSLVREVKARCPILLSGGIDLANVDEAMKLVADPANSIAGLDVSSGVESAPGVKDLDKITTFLARCLQ